jgi:hypothetical protein
MYGNLVANSDTSCITCGWYHGGMNMHMSDLGHPKDPTCGLKGGFLGRSFLGELLLGESLGCPPSNGWWAKPLGT